MLKLVAIDDLDQHRPATDGEVKRLGANSVIVVLKADTATVEIAVHDADTGRALSPMQPVVAESP